VVSKNSNRVEDLAGKRGRGEVDEDDFPYAVYLLLGIFAGWLNRHQQAIIE
jgi:hypothetical protein